MSAIEVGWENAELQDFEIDMQYSWWTATGEGAYGTWKGKDTDEGLARSGRIKGQSGR
jgi:hypothetical protein